MRTAAERLEVMRRRLERVQERTAERFDEQGEIRAELVKKFNERLAQVEKNTARIDRLEAALAAHDADVKRHTGKAT